MKAVILAGGRARRLGGVDKATVLISGRPFIVVRGAWRPDITVSGR